MLATPISPTSHVRNPSLEFTVSAYQNPSVCQQFSKVRSHAFAGRCRLHACLSSEVQRPAKARQISNMSSLLHDCLGTHHRGETTATPLAARSNACKLPVSSPRTKLSSVRSIESQLPACQCRRSGRCSMTTAAAVEEASPVAAPEEPREDDVLPDSLTDALTQASTATASALQGIGGRYLVEVLIPEFWDPAAGAVFTEEGDQQRFWKLTKRFAEGLAERLGGSQICAVYPDSGVAVMLANQWQDAPFRITSLGDRQPVSEDDEIVILAAPDPQGLTAARSITETHEESKHIIMFNPRLASWDVGVGLNVRRIRQEFLSKFLTTYALRPIGEMGSVFRQYPNPWKVFVEDKSTPGRYLLAANCDSRPAGDALDEIIDKALALQSAKNSDGSAEGSGLFGSLSRQLGSVAGFMRSLTK